MAPSICAVPMLPATDEAFRPYGRLFTKEDSPEARVDITRWPQAGWRRCYDGVSGGTTSGSFVLEWREGAHAASNSGVADGDYLFAWTTVDAATNSAATFAADEKSLANVAFDSSATAGPTSPSTVAYSFTEINYHADGGQTFFSPEAPVIVCVALPSSDRAPDDVLPEDFVAFLLPPGLGCHVNAFVYHCPPIATVFDRKTVMRTVQGKVHSKFYYDPLAEHNTLLQIPLSSSSSSSSSRDVV